MAKKQSNKLELRAVRIAYEKTGDYLAFITNLSELAKAGNPDAKEIMDKWCVWAHEQRKEYQPLPKVEPISLDGDIYTE